MLLLEEPGSRFRIHLTLLRTSLPERPSNASAAQRVSRSERPASVEVPPQGVKFGDGFIAPGDGQRSG